MEPSVRDLTEQAIAEHITRQKDCLEGRLDNETAAWFNDVISDYAHDVRGRIMSMQLSLYLLKKKSAGVNESLMTTLREELDDLTHMIEAFQHAAKPCEEQA